MDMKNIDGMVGNFFESGDLLIAISSSGNSVNILNAVSKAKSKIYDVITLSGFKSDNKLRFLGDVFYYLGIENYGVIECFHQIILHAMIDNYVTVIEHEQIVNKVLITGVAGFIGSNLLDYLIDNTNWELDGIDNLSTGNRKNIQHLKNNDRFKFMEKECQNFNIFKAVRCYISFSSSTKNST